MPEFKTKEEYEAWKAQRVSELKKKQEEPQEPKPTHPSAPLDRGETTTLNNPAEKEKFNIRKIPMWLNIIIGIIGFFILWNIISVFTAKHTILQGSLFFLFLCIYPFTYYRLMFPKKIMQIRCPNCKYEGNGIFRMKGSWGIELILWMFFIIPGLIYSLWRGNSRRIICPKCSFEFVEKLGIVKQY